MAKREGDYCPKCLSGPYKSKAARRAHMSACRSTYTPHVRAHGLGGR